MSECCGPKLTTDLVMKLLNADKEKNVSPKEPSPDTGFDESYVEKELRKNLFMKNATPEQMITPIMAARWQFERCREEIERLKKQVTYFTNYHQRTLGELTESLEKTKRYETALKKIADYCGDHAQVVAEDALKEGLGE